MIDNDNTNSQRRRGTALEQALFSAILDELKAVGYQKLTFDSVALRAGTSKAVLYRRWPSRQELVVAALRAQQPAYPAPVPDTGSLRGDLLAIFSHISNRRDSLPLDIGLGLLADSASDAKLHEYYLRQIRQAGVSMMMPVLRRAEERGEIPTSALPERLITLPLDLARHENVITGKVPTKAAIVQIIDDIYAPLLKSSS